MLAIAATVGGTFLLVAARYAAVKLAMKGGTSAFRAGRRAVRNKAAAGGEAVAVPSLMMGLENNKIVEVSEALTKVPMEQGLETLMQMDEWSNKEKAAVVNHFVDQALMSKGFLDPDQKDFVRTKKMARAIGHLIVGDEASADSIAQNLGIQTDDLKASLRAVKKANPEGAIWAIGAQTFDAFRRVTIQKNLLDAGARPVFSQDGSQPETESKKRLSDFNLDNVSDKNVTAIFDTAVSNMGLIKSAVFHTRSLFARASGKMEQVQRRILDKMETGRKFAALQDAAFRGKLSARMGDDFGAGRNAEAEIVPA